ncbi:MAG: hypothetical protein ISP84_01535 [Candidatus Poseidonia sp.]|nr:hypothetical protein [Poseidonia sp.]
MEGGEEAVGRVVSRLEALEGFGFPLEAMLDFVNEHPGGELDRIEWLEERRQTASDLEDRMAALTTVAPSTTEALTEFRNKIYDPFTVEDVLHEVERAMRTVAPWEPPLHRAKVNWIAQGLADTWSLLYQRMVRLDPSSHGAVSAFQHLFEHPERYDEIFRHLETVEGDEQRQRGMIDQSAEALRQEGYDLGDLTACSLLEALDLVERWQGFHDERQRLALAVRQWIEPFDRELAQERWRQCSNLRSLESRNTLDEFGEELQALAQSLEERRKQLSDRINGWREQGIVFPHQGELQPQDLMEWEANHDVVEAMVERHLALVERWNRFARRWPSRTASSADLVGDLEQTDGLQDEVEALDALWKKVELDALDVLQGYEDMGLDVHQWRQRVFEDPLNALERLTAERPRWEQRMGLVKRLNALDVSFSGGDDVEVRLMVVTAEDSDQPLLNEVEAFVEQAERRNQRHRTMLEDELAALRRDGVPFVEVQTRSMSLGEFERHLSEVQRHRTSGLAPGSVSLTPSMIDGLRNELDTLEQQGWSVSRWKHDLTQRPLEVAQALGVARSRIQSHDALRRRLQRLPWGNDLALATQVELQLRDPSCLEVVANSIPQWARHLAQRPTEDPEFKLTAWEPRQARPTLLPVPESLERPVLRPTTPLDDAHEAILEAMDMSEEGDQEKDEPVANETVEERRVLDPPEREASVANVQASDTIPTVEDLGTEQPPAPDSVVTAMVEPAVGSDPSLAEKTVSLDPSLPPSKGTMEALNRLAELLAFIGKSDLANAVNEEGLAGMGAVRRGLAQHVNVEPRDIRIGRLLRLTLRLLPQGDEHDAVRAKLLHALSETVAPLKRWTRRRLEARHSGAEGDFLEDTHRLGIALERIPGLGRHVPLEKDVWPLSHDLSDLEQEVQRLKGAAFLPSAGGVQA